MLNDTKETKPHKRRGGGGFHQNKIEGSDSLLFRIYAHVIQIIKYKKFPCFYTHNTVCKIKNFLYFTHVILLLLPTFLYIQLTQKNKK